MPVLYRSLFEAAIPLSIATNTNKDHKYEFNTTDCYIHMRSRSDKFELYFDTFVITKLHSYDQITQPTD